MARLSWQTERVVTDQVVNTVSGDTVVGNQVYYVTGEGNHGVVFIPTDKWNAKHVTETVRASAKVLDEIAALSEGMV